MSQIKFKKLSPEAIIPSRAREGDAGLDVSIIGISQTLSNGIIHYKTGLAVEPPEGYYFRVYGRSSLHKLGYMVATGVSVIDAGYRGELIIPLVKITNEFVEFSNLDKEPQRVCQLVLSKLHSAEIIEVDGLSETNRGDGGFGSTN